MTKKDVIEYLDNVCDKRSYEIGRQEALKEIEELINQCKEDGSDIDSLIHLRFLLKEMSKK